MLTLSVVTDIKSLEQHEKDWNDLTKRLDSIVPTVSFAWVTSFLRNRISIGQPWLCILAQNGDRLVGVLPLLIRSQRIGFAKVQKLTPPFDNHTYATDVMLDPGCADIVFRAMIKRALACQLRRRIVEFSRVPANASMLTFLSTLAACRPVVRDVSFGAYIPIPANFEHYRAGLSGNFRSNLNKAHTKLERHASHEFCIIQNRSDVAENLRKFMEVEASGWKGHEGTALLCSDDLIEFYTLLCSALNKTGSVEWHFLAIGEKTVAANLAIRMGKKLVIWKLGYDPGFSQYSPGSLLLEHVIRFHSVGPSEVEEIDFLTNFSWYSKWCVNKRTYYQLTLYANNWFSTIFLYCPHRLLNGARVFRRKIRELLDF